MLTKPVEFLSAGFFIFLSNLSPCQGYKAEGNKIPRKEVK
nr:MAG TPA: hypothetical protein [Caudoviricetes sp.]